MVQVGCDRAVRAATYWYHTTLEEISNHFNTWLHNPIFHSQHQDHAKPVVLCAGQALPVVWDLLSPSQPGRTRARRLLGLSQFSGHFLL